MSPNNCGACFPFNVVFGKNTDCSTFPKITEDLADSFLRLVDSFLLGVTIRGQIVVVSSAVESYLGHCQVSAHSSIQYD